MKRIFLLLLFVISLFTTYGQQAAYKGSGHSGIYGVFSNPANVASNYRNWDVNLLSVSGLVANDKVKFSLSDLGEDVQKKLFEGDGKLLSGIVNAEVLGPSFMLRIAPKHSIAFTTRARVFGNIGTLDTKLAEAITDAKNMKSLSQKLSTGSQRVVINGWSEIGASWGGVIFEKGKHSLKAGATLKYLRGVGNSFADIKDVNATLSAELIKNQEVKPYLTDGTGSLYLVNSGVDMFGGDFNSSDLGKSNGSGVGFDLGISYELQNESDSIGWCANCRNKGYKLKVGMSLLDIGKIQYNTVAGNAFRYTLNIPKGEKFYLDGLDGSIQDMQTYLDKSPYAQKEAISETYSPSLPITLNLMLDYYWGHNFFTELSGQFSLVDKDKKVENAYYYNGFTLTFRFETKYWGVYMPLNYNSISAFNAGLTLRMGPIMVGSGSVISSLLAENKQTDVFVGVRFGI